MNDTFLDAVRGDARGRWLDILPTLAPALADACARAGRHVPCPVHGGKDGFRLFKDARETGGGVCNTCNAGRPMAGGFDVLQWVSGWDFSRALAEVAGYLGMDNGHPAVPSRKPLRNAPRKADDNPNPNTKKYLNALWKEAAPDTGRIADYLRHRGLSGTVAEGLRYHPALPYYEDGKEMGTFAAMLAQVQTLEGEVVAVHRTYLDPAGPGKAPVEKPKKLTEAVHEGATRGAAIRLAEAGQALALAEGIETALAVLEATGAPAWATVSAGGMERVELPSGANRIEVWADHDKSGVGRRAAEVLAARCVLKGLDVRLLLPPREGTDWLDVFNEEGPGAPGSSPGQALRKAREEAEPWEPRVLAQARAELERLEAEEVAEEESPPVPWEEALAGALFAEDPIAALKEEVIPRLVPLEGVGLDAALRRTVEAYREYGIRLDTLRREARTARQKANQAKKARRETIASHRETLSQRDAILRSLVSKGHTDTGGGAPGKDSISAPSKIRERDLRRYGYERPWLFSSTPEITQAIDLTQRGMLLLPGAPVYQRARCLVRVETGASPPAGITRDAESQTIGLITVDSLWELAHRAVLWLKVNEEKEPVNAKPPPWIGKTLAARPSWSFPPLTSLASAPVLRPDGTVLEEPGYDRATGILATMRPDEFPPVPDQPTPAAVAAALVLVLDPLADFPFKEPTHKAAALAALLTPLARPAVGCVPLFAVRAPVRGTGKSLFADVVALLATGRLAPRWAPSDSEEEDRKRLLALALAGDQVVLIDNVKHALGSPALDAAITSQSVRDRILGKSAIVEAPWIATLLATGNNLEFSGDLARRVVPIELDPVMERPEERSDFRHPNLLAWVRENRPTLVSAALTLLRAYVAAGRPAQKIPEYGSFEQWSALVRSCVVWLGLADPCEGRAELEAAADPVHAALTALLASWYACFGTSGRTLGEAYAETSSPKGDDKERLKLADLREAINALDPKLDRGVSSLKAPGRFLRKHAGRVLGGMRLVSPGTGHSKTNLWRIQITAPPFAGFAGFAGFGPMGASFLGGVRVDERKREEDEARIQGEKMAVGVTNPANPANPANPLKDREPGDESEWTEKVDRKFGDPEPETQAGQDPGAIGPKIPDKTPMDNSDLVEFVAALRKEGVTLSIRDGDLQVTGNLKPGMAAVIERHRSALVSLLQEGNPFED